MAPTMSTSPVSALTFASPALLSKRHLPRQTPPASSTTKGPLSDHLAADTIAGATWEWRQFLGRTAAAAQTTAPSAHPAAAHRSRHCPRRGAARRCSARARARSPSPPPPRSPFRTGESHTRRLPRQPPRGLNLRRGSALCGGPSGPTVTRYPSRVKSSCFRLLRCRLCSIKYLQYTT